MKSQIQKVTYCCKELFNYQCYNYLYLYLMQIQVAGLTPSQKYYQSVGMFSLNWPNTSDKAEINAKKLCGELQILSTKTFMNGLKSRRKSENAWIFFQFLIPYQKSLFVFGLRTPHWDTDLCGDGQSSSLNQVLLHFYHTNLWREHCKTW